mgnify:CR=1 FL=1
MDNTCNMSAPGLLSVVAMVLTAAPCVPGEDVAGFSVRVPRGWNISTDARLGRLEIRGAKQARVIVWPVFMPNWAEETVAPVVLRKLAAGVWAGMQWEPVQAFGAGVVRAYGHSGTRVGVAALTWITSAQGAAGYLYLVAAEKNGYQQLETAFAQILGSCRAVGAPASNGEALPTFVGWRDPNEKAFTLQVPSQWKVTGGLFRPNRNQVNPAWELVSPDGQIWIAGGDATLPLYMAPASTFPQSLLKEGARYSEMLVKRYVPGAEFAREYVLGKVARACPDVTITETRERPDVVEVAGTRYARASKDFSASLTAGEVSFTCRQAGRLMHGYYLAGTLLAKTPTVSAWCAEHLYGYLAPEGRTGLARSILHHTVASTRFNSAWLDSRRNSTLVIDRVMEDESWRGKIIIDELSRRRSSAVVEVESVPDPASGPFDPHSRRMIDVESSADHYWLDEQGAIVGVRIGARPDLDFRKLVRAP